LIEEGDHFAIYRSRIELKGTLEDVLSYAENINNPIVFIQTVNEDSAKGIITCELSIHGKNLDDCTKLLEDLLSR